MKASSLWQPWATLVALNEKRIETRSWPTSYRGPLAIHAAKKMTNELARLTWLTEPFASVLHKHGLESLPRGCVVATCELVGCKLIPEIPTVWHTPMGDWTMTEQEIAFGDYTPGRYAWLLADIVALPGPVPARGAQGLWEWRPEGVGA